MTDEEDEFVDDYSEDLDPDTGKSQQQIIDEMTGQLDLFGDEDLDEK